jgi:hypothetical protein
MLSLILAIALNSAPVAHAETAAMTKLYSYQGTRAERHQRAEQTGRWLDQLDVVRANAIDARANPFDDRKASPFDDDLKADPFESEPKLFWWATRADRSEKW